jgi:hypothetical protein
MTINPAPDFDCPAMHRRLFLAALAGIALFSLPPRSTAAEAAPLSAGFVDVVRTQVDQRLQKEGYVQFGEVRRKGNFLIVTASKGPTPWRLVVDARTGEIVGQRPLNPAFTVSQQGF